MFAWTDTETTAQLKQRAKRNLERRAEMYRRDIESRAALLQRLGFPAARAKSRIRGYVAWDFEMTGTPRHATEVDKVVDQIYKRGGIGQGTPTV